MRLQTQPSPPNHVYNGLIDCVKKTLAWEGPAGFYKGVLAPLVGQLFFRSAMFWTNGEWNRYASAGGTQPMSYLQYGIGGGLTWLVASAIECPLQTVSSQLQVAILRAKADPTAVPEFKGVVDYVAHAPRKYGIGALYKGVVPHLTRNMVGGFFHFGAFEAVRREIAKRKDVPVAQVGTATNLLAGSIGGVLFWTVTYPVDVIKSAMQGDANDPAKRKYHGTVDTVRKLWAEGGASRFARGYSACLARSIPANAVLLTAAFKVKETGYHYFGIQTGGGAAPASSKPAPMIDNAASVADE